MIYKYIIHDGNGYKMGLTTQINDSNHFVMARPVFKFKNEKYKFLKGLEILISQGIDVFNSLKVLKHSNEYKSERKIIEKIYNKMNAGESFYNALKSSTDLPKYYLTLINVAELSDSIDEPLKEANRIRERNLMIKNKIKTAISYPVFLFFISVMMLIVMSTVVLPMFQTMFDSFKAELPLITKIAMSIGMFFSKYLVTTIVVIFLLTLLFNLMRYFSIDLYLFAERFKYKYSIFRKIRQESFYEFFFKNFSILYNRTENTSDTIKNIARAEENLFLRMNLLELDRGISTGENFVEMAAKSNLFTEFSTALFTGVRTTEAMKTVSENLAEHYTASVDNRIELMTKWATPIVTIVVGIVIGLMALGLVLPIFNLSSFI